MTNKDAEHRLKELFSRKEYLADPFWILSLDQVDLSSEIPSAAPQLKVPRSLDEVFSKHDDPQQRDLLEALVLWAQPSTEAIEPHDLRARAEEVRRRYVYLRERGRISVIDDVDDQQISELLREILPDEDEGAGLFGRMRRTLRKSITTILTISRDTGAAIVSRGHDLADLLKKKIAQLRAPERLDELVNAKEEFTKRWYSFPGGKGGKVIFTIAVGTAGFAVAFTVAPVAGIALAAGGLALSLIDP
jgi:hypothetical protein